VKTIWGGRGGVGGSSAEVKKKRATRLQNSPDLRRPALAPNQVFLPILPVGIFSIANPEIVRRRRDHKIDICVGQAGHAFDAVFKTQVEFGHTRKMAEQIRFVQRKVVT